MKGKHLAFLGFGFSFVLALCCPTGYAQERTGTIAEDVAAMSLDDRIAQRMMLGFNGTMLPSPFRRYIETHAVGGFILFRHNLHRGADSIGKLTAALQTAFLKQPTHLPALIAVDLEGGIIKRFPPDVLQFPSARRLGTIDDPGEVREICTHAARKIYSLGINMNLAPVLEPCGRVMQTRVFDCSVEKIAETGSIFIQCFQNEGVVCAAKHFPGNAGVDPDKRLGRMEGSLADYEKTNFLPFRRAIREGVGAIMVSHVYLDDVDPEMPATLSEKVMDGLLRQGMGFDGVIITDDLLASSSRGRVLESVCSVPESAIRAILAGADIIMLSDAGFAPAVQKAIREAVVAKRISEGRLNAGVERILKLKARFNIIGDSH